MAPPLLSHERQHGLTDGHGRDEIQLEEGAKLLGRGVFEARAEPASSIVDEHVHGAEAGRHGIHHVAHRRDVGHVDRIGGDVPPPGAQLTGEPLEALAPARAEGQAHARFREHSRGGLANAGGGPGDERDASGRLDGHGGARRHCRRSAASRGC